MNPDAHRGLFQVIAFALAVSFAVAVFLLANSQGTLLAVAMAGFLLLIITSLMSSTACLYALVLVATTEALYKGLAPSMFTMLVKDLFLWILLLRLFWVSQRQRDFRWLHQRLTTPAVIFVCYCVAMMFAPSTRSLLLAVAGLRVWSLWMPLYYPCYQLFGTRKQVLRFAAVLTALQLPICLYGIVQGNIGYEHTKIIPGFYELTAFYQVARQDTDEGALTTGEEGMASSEAPDSPDASEGFDRGFKPIMAVRACAVYTSPGYFGTMAVMSALLGLGMLGAGRTAMGRMIGLATALAGVGGLLASGSRAPMVGLGVGLAAMALISARKGIVAAGIALLVLGSLYVLKDVAGAGATRIQRNLSMGIALERSLDPLQRGLQAALQRPLGNGIATGIGAGRLVYSGAIDVEQAKGTRFIENEFGRALAELGFAGAFLWLWMVWTPLREAIRAIRTLGFQRDGLLAAGLFGLMVALFVQLGVGSALYGGAGMYYYVFAAMIKRLAETPADAEDELRTAGPLRRTRPLRRYGFVNVRVPDLPNPPQRHVSMDRP